MPISAQSKAILGEEDLVVEETLRQLRHDVLPVLSFGIDLTSKATKGKMSLNIPNTSGYSITDRPTPANPSNPTVASPERGVDKLVRGKAKTVQDWISDEDEEEVIEDAMDTFYFESSEDIVEYIQQKTFDVLAAAGAIIPSTAGGADTPNPNRFQLAGAGNALITYDQIVDKHKEMTDDKVKKAGRVIFASTTQYAAMKKMAEFRDADKTGLQVSVAISGQIGMVDGAMVIEVPFLAADQIIFCGAKSFAAAFWKQVVREHQRYSDKKAYHCSQDFNYEVAALRDGGLIYLGNSAA
ncbi:MAG: hypothetical protein ACPGJV_02710 [Bacteriovoracaceae bacterium]